MMMKPMAQALSHPQVIILMYLDNWLVHTPDNQQCKSHQDLTLCGHASGDSSFFVKSHFIPIQMMVWLRMEWNSYRQLLSSPVYEFCSKLATLTSLETSPIASGKVYLALSIMQ